MAPPRAALLLALALALAAPGTHAGLYSPKDDVVMLTRAAFDERVIAGPEFWVVEWYANWCGGCRMVSPWYKAAATKLKGKGVHFGAMDMDQHGPLGNSYGVSGMPHIMAFAPGDEANPVGMGGLGGAESVVNFAEGEFKKLSDEVQAAALAASGKSSGPPPPPPKPPPPPPPPSRGTEAFLTSLNLEAFGAGFVKEGHATTTSLAAMDAYELGELGDELGMETKQILALSRGLRKLARNEL